MKYHIITTTQGNTTLGCSSNGVTAYPLIAGDTVDSSQEFHASHDEYVDLLGKQHTHNLVFDPDTRKVLAHPKPTKKVTAKT